MAYKSRYSPRTGTMYDDGVRRHRERMADIISAQHQGTLDRSRRMEGEQEEAETQAAWNVGDPAMMGMMIGAPFGPGGAGIGAAAGAGLGLLRGALSGKKPSAGQFAKGLLPSMAGAAMGGSALARGAAGGHGGWGAGGAGPTPPPETPMGPPAPPPLPPDAPSYGAGAPAPGEGFLGGMDPGAMSQKSYGSPSRALSLGTSGPMDTPPPMDDWSSSLEMPASKHMIGMGPPQVGAPMMPKNISPPAADAGMGDGFDFAGQDTGIFSGGDLPANVDIGMPEPQKFAVEPGMPEMEPMANPAQQEMFTGLPQDARARAGELLWKMQHGNLTPAEEFELETLQRIDARGG